MKKALSLAIRFKTLDRPPSNKLLIAFHRDAGWAHESKEIAKLAKAAPGVIWMAAFMQGEQPTGLCRLQVSGKSVAFLSEFVVKKEFSRRGIGSAFLDHIVRFCVAGGIERLALRPTPTSSLFYVSRGFIQDPLFPEVLVKIFTPRSHQFDI